MQQDAQIQNFTNKFTTQLWAILYIAIHSPVLNVSSQEPW
jgi:hypothetical protein